MIVIHLPITEFNSNLYVFWYSNKYQKHMIFSDKKFIGTFVFSSHLSAEMYIKTWYF